MKKLKEKLNAKLSKNGGFTLVEMLIVVAIIAILVAVSIPLVNGALDKARKATDDANERAAKAAGAIYYLTTAASDAGWTETAAATYPYDADAGKLGAKDGTITNGYGKYDTHKNKYINVTITTSGDVTVAWST